MIRVLFVCHGNICRSTMAESIFSALVKEAGLEKEIAVSSAATHCDELGNPPYPYAVRTLAAHGIGAMAHRARLLNKSDGETYDYIVGMDEENRIHMKRILGKAHEKKVSLLLEFTPTPHAIADPWYTRDFELSFSEIEEGCRALLNKIKSENCGKFS